MERELGDAEKELLKRLRLGQLFPKIDHHVRELRQVELHLVERMRRQLGELGCGVSDSPRRVAQRPHTEQEVLDRHVRTRALRRHRARRNGRG